MVVVFACPASPVGGFAVSLSQPIDSDKIIRLTRTSAILVNFILWFPYGSSAPDYPFN
jgi:hypothetical protein